jgi:protein-arginine kinase activator protein McsA
VGQQQTFWWSVIYTKLDLSGRVDQPFGAEHITKCRQCGVTFTSRVTPPELVCKECERPTTDAMVAPKVS